MTVPMSPEVAAHFNRKMRRNMRAMAIGLGLDPDGFHNPTELWNAMTIRMAGGRRPGENVIGDPYGVFVTTRCERCQSEHTFVWKTPSGGPADEHEVAGFIAHLRDNEKALANCPECGGPINGFQSDMTRMSMFSTEPHHGHT